jgi:hypothetical protein
MVEDDRLTRVGLTDGRMVARTAVFVRPGNLPRDDGLLRIQAGASVIAS